MEAERLRNKNNTSFAGKGHLRKWGRGSKRLFPLGYRNFILEKEHQYRVIKWHKEEKLLIMKKKQKEVLRRGEKERISAQTPPWIFCSH